MTRTDAKGRLQRLDALSALLKQDAHWTVAGLARHTGVSARTIARDLALLRDQGLPIDTDRGRGGGVRLDGGWGVGRVNLAEAEAVDLLLGIAVAERLNSPIFLSHLAAAKRRIIASFSPDKRARVNRLKDRILVGETASVFVQAGANLPPDKVSRVLNAGFLGQERLSIRYRREDGTRSERQIDPHFLLLKYPVWYLVAWDHLRAAPRTFRCDRVEHAIATGDRFNLRPKDAFSASLSNDDLIVR